jgi:hypothetical protein
VGPAARGAQVREEPAVPVQLRLVLVRQPVPADLPLRLAGRVPAHSAVLLQRRVPADSLLEERPGLAHLVLEPAAPVDLLLSRQSFSAAMARSTPSPVPIYEPVPRSS